ncbi:MAG: hypothetical protein JW830_05650 [Bacteroidales bacterium]|nr:hypothetical protein [Bacteroidales bacterium]
MKSSVPDKLGKLCKRCYKNQAVDSICPACKNELISLYDNKLTWRTAYEVEKASKSAMRYTRDEAEEELY